MKNTVTNKFNCSNPLWVKMDVNQARFYNSVRCYTRKEICPVNKGVTDEAFDVISHNFAYLSSCIFSR